MVICLEQGANDLHMVQLVLLPPHHLCFSKTQNGSTFWYLLTRAVVEMRPFNECSCHQYTQLVICKTTIALIVCL